MWSQEEEREDIMVVSEIGLIWSPKIEPERTADAERKSTSPENFEPISMEMGTSTANVPQEVPVAKEIRADEIKIKAGIK